MVYVQLKGRLGNNLFQIAAGASLAKQNNDIFCVVAPNSAIDPGISTEADELNELRKSVFRQVNVVSDLPSGISIYREKEFAFRPIPYQPEVVLSGYFQSEKYFDKALVRELFAIDDETKAYINRKYGALLAQKPTSIHIRRGDYIRNLDYHPICSLSYFRDAMKVIGSDTPFLIVTNDIEWCKQKFRGDNVYFTDKESAVVDLYLQSMCANNIISNSSFSWWGAWLNSNPSKKVIYPSPWFGISATEIDDSDLIPDCWTSVNNRMSVFLRIVAQLRKLKRQLYQKYWQKRR